MPKRKTEQVKTNSTTYPDPEGDFIFVAGSSDKDDPFGENNSRFSIASDFHEMRANLQNIYIVKTNFVERVQQLAPYLTWAPNIWIGVVVSNESHIHRIDLLRKIHPAVRLVSFESISKPLPDLSLRGIDWVFVSECDEDDSDLVMDIRDQCRADRVRFYHPGHGMELCNIL